MFVLRLLLPAFLLAAACVTAEAAPSISSPTGLSVRLEPEKGEYHLVSKGLSWAFGGSLESPLKHITTVQGRDQAGDYQQLAFAWQAGNIPMNGWVRLYNEKALVVFSQTSAVAAERPPPAFPAFTELPSSLHVFTYGHHEFAPPRFATNDISTPWLLFDDDGKAFVLSPASHFMVATITGDGRQNLASHFNPELRNLPAGFTQQTLLALGQGINRTWELWGHGLLDLQGAKRPAYDADASLKYLGYWTDNGAAYYYNYDLAKGYAGTLQSLVEHYRQEQIPIRYVQLDSWWYSKTTTDADGTAGKPIKANKLPAGEWNRYGGLWEYKAHTNLFPNGLDSFQKAIGLPLITHNRWIDPASPYHQQYEISGIAAVDPKWWDHVADYMKASGIVTYEQDWLDRIYTYSPAFLSNVGTGEAFLDNMARACAERGITLQYCMPYPCYFLQGSRYPNLTTIRTSGDRFNRSRWSDFLYTSRLASCLGIWPWADVYMSAETNNVLLSTLSAGPVGIGDALGTENKANLLRAVRADGVIVKPDVPIVPLDSTYLADAQKKPGPVVATTYTDHGGTRTEYVFAFNRPKTPAGKVRLEPAELGLCGPAYLHDYFSGAGSLLRGESPFSAQLGSAGCSFYVIAPVGKSGIAFLGDRDKFVGTGKQRIASLRDEPGKLTVGVLFAENEKSVVLHGYADAAPKASVLAGQGDAVQYDTVTHHFTVEVKPEATTPLDRSSGDPVRAATLILEVPK